MKIRGTSARIVEWEPWCAGMASVLWIFIVSRGCGVVMSVFAVRMRVWLRWGRGLMRDRQEVYCEGFIFYPGCWE